MYGGRGVRTVAASARCGHTAHAAASLHIIMTQSSTANVEACQLHRSALDLGVANALILAVLIFGWSFMAAMALRLFGQPVAIAIGAILGP